MSKPSGNTGYVMSRPPSSSPSSEASYMRPAKGYSSSAGTGLYPPALHLHHGIHPHKITSKRYCPSLGEHSLPCRTCRKFATVNTADAVDCAPGLTVTGSRRSFHPASEDQRLNGSVRRDSSPGVELAVAWMSHRRPRRYVLIQ
ncbi:hypothetical protein BaRGS_00004396, partial [Batillaria attramentaria]